jgi:hypothetical protein
MAEKADSLITEQVFLDTCIFVTENYCSIAYQTLIRLATAGAVKLKITDITLQEIKQQITEKIDEAAKSMQAKSGKSAILRNFDEYGKLMERFAAQKTDSLSDELWARVSKELTDAGIDVIPATDLPAGPIFESYFAQKPPFGEVEKRKEFPDAFVVAALTEWCENNGEKIYVITTDGTVREACELSDHLYLLRSLADFVDLALRRDEQLEIAAEYLQDHVEGIEEAVKEAIEDQYIDLKDEDGDGQAAVDEVSSLTVDDIVANDGDTMVLRCSATVGLSIHVSYVDRNMTVYDREEGREYVVGHVSADLDRTIDVSAEVTILRRDQASYLVQKVVINDGDPISIYVDEDAETHWK